VADLQAELAKFGQQLLDKLKEENDQNAQPAKERS
jgi:ubiquitin C-terminal hydrolase